VLVLDSALLAELFFLHVQHGGQAWVNRRDRKRRNQRMDLGGDRRLDAIQCHQLMVGIAELAKIDVGDKPGRGNPVGGVIGETGIHARQSLKGVRLNLEAPDPWARRGRHEASHGRPGSTMSATEVARLETHVGVKTVREKVAVGVIGLEGFIAKASQTAEIRMGIADHGGVEGGADVRRHVLNFQGKDLEEVAIGRMDDQEAIEAQEFHIVGMVSRVLMCGGEVDHGAVDDTIEEQTTTAPHRTQVGASVGPTGQEGGVTTQAVRDLAGSARHQVETLDLVNGHGWAAGGKGPETLGAMTNGKEGGLEDTARHGRHGRHGRQGDRVAELDFLIIRFEGGVSVSTVEVSVTAARIGLRFLFVGVGVVVVGLFLVAAAKHGGDWEGGAGSEHCRCNPLGLDGQRRNDCGECRGNPLGLYGKRRCYRGECKPLGLEGQRRSCRINGKVGRSLNGKVGRIRYGREVGNRHTKPVECQGESFDFHGGGSTWCCVRKRSCHDHVCFWVHQSGGSRR
jgi:hypothetical protein